MRDGDDSAIRRNRSIARRRVILRLGALPLLIGAVLMVLTPLWGAVRVWMSEAAQERARRELASLPYPAPSFQADQSPLVYGENQGRTLVATPPLPLNLAKRARDDDRLLLEARTGFEGKTRKETEAHVLITFAGAGSVFLPNAAYESTPLVLHIDGQACSVYSTQFEATQLARTPRAGCTSEIVFSIPTREFLDFVKATVVTGSIGPYEFEVPEAARRVARELAATLKPQ